jgi:ABC-type cobalamin/Fe3+-siderophores transport system ATPase subunit
LLLSSTWCVCFSACLPAAAVPAAAAAAGKSSLIGALFRLTEIESGLITIDGVNTKAVALRQLRSSMALIPQVSQLSSQVLEHRV